MAKKKVYYVEIPFTGKVGLYIAAENAQNAIDRGLDLADINNKNPNVEIDYHRHVVQGNRFSGMLAEAFAEVDTSMGLYGVDNPDDVTDEDYEDDEEE